MRMKFNPRDEFPHTVEIGHRELSGDFPHQERVFVPKDIYRGFMDTPSANETIMFHQQNDDYQRNLYLPYELEVDTEKDLFKYEGKTFACMGEGVDQGGMNEIKLYRLKEVPING